MSESQTPSRIIKYLRAEGWFLFGAIVVALYFCYFVLPGLHGRFNGDDPMNIYNAWAWGGKAIAKGMLLFFSPFYRPMGTLFFYVFYKYFGLNPLPYHIAITAILLVNVILAYYCAKILSRSRIVGGLCALLTAYHANMPQAVFLPAFVFDALCFTFYFAALGCYLRMRSKDNPPRKTQILVFVLLYIAALESKEMAVTLPVLLLAYEAFWNSPALSLKGISMWVRSSLGPCLLAALITAVFLIGKSTGPDSLSNNPMYQLTISWQFFLKSQTKFFKELFFIMPSSPVNPYRIVMLWLGLGCIACFWKKNYLKWATLVTVIAPLPIAFIPDRGGVSLCIPWFGWSLWLAALAAAFCVSISSLPGVRRFRSQAQAVLLIALIICYWRYTDRHNAYSPEAYKGADEYFWALKGELARVLPRVGPGAQIAYYQDGTDSWDAKFVTALFYHDPTVVVWLCRYNKLSLEELNKVDYILSFDRRVLTILKHPGEPFRIPSSMSSPKSE